MIHQRLRRRGGSMGRRPPAPSPPPSGPASTISSVVSGLMVSLAVVVVAILAVLVLVFSDQPATQRVKGRRGRPSSVQEPGSSAPHAATALVLRGPPPAHVLQQQLALPSARPRAPRPGTAPAASGVASSKPPAAATEPDRAYDVRLGDQEDISVFTRVRSSVALLVLLAGVGTAVALAIGSILYMASLALRHTLR